MGFGTDLKNVYLPCANRIPHFMNGAGQARMTEPYFVEEIFKIRGLEPFPVLPGKAGRSRPSPVHHLYGRTGLEFSACLEISFIRLLQPVFSKILFT